MKDKKKKIFFLKKNLKLFVIILLIFTNILMIIFYIYKTNPKTLRKLPNPYPFIDFSRSFISQEHFLTTINPLREKVKEMVKDFGQGSVSIYIEYINTGANISINPDIYIWPASLTKIPLAMAVMKKVEKREWSLSNELVLIKGDANNMSGDSENPLSEYPVGTRFTIEKLLEELIVNSDNTAYYILLRNLHEDDLAEVIRSLGMEFLFTKEGKMSAKEYSRILRALYSASFLNREDSQKVLELMNKSKFKEFLSSGLDDSVIFSHKYGEDDILNIYSDSGIVYLENRPYIISVMVQGQSNVDYKKEKVIASSFMKELSGGVYKYFLETQN
jgi:beta-lactamase class A